MTDQLSISEIEGRLKQERADADAANADAQNANARFGRATANAGALELLLKLARAYAAGDAMPDVRTVPY